MKKIGSILFAVLMTIFVLSSATFADDSKLTESKFKTSAQSWMDKSKVESTLKKIDGIDDAELSMDSKVLTVTYDAKKVNTETIRTMVEELHVTADLLSPKDNNKALEIKKSGEVKKN